MLNVSLAEPPPCAGQGLGYLLRVARMPTGACRPMRLGTSGLSVSNKPARAWYRGVLCCRVHTVFGVGCTHVPSGGQGLTCVLLYQCQACVVECPSCPLKMSAGHQDVDLPRSSWHRAETFLEGMIPWLQSAGVVTAFSTTASRRSPPLFLV